MIKALKAFFEESIKEPEQPLDQHGKSLACCALMIEIAAIDEHFCADEQIALKQEMQRQFKLQDAELDELVDLATREQKETSSMYPFTKMVNDACTKAEKFELMVGMWRIAFADQQLDKYEEYMIRKLADLLHVGHSDFIRAKKVAQQA